MYDDLAEYYDLIYADWDASMRRHGDFISHFLPTYGRVLDIAAGIGTQARPLAAIGHEVVARDLSPLAIQRLQREAADRGLTIDAAVADMRAVGQTVQAPFDAVICFDNSLPHLLSESDIVSTLLGLSALLSRGGILLVSVRDYSAVDRGGRSFHRYGERWRSGRRFRLAQEWDWYAADHYQTTMVIDEEVEGEWRSRVRASSRYYAITLPDLLTLFARGGLEAEIVQKPKFFQPVIRAGAG